MTYVTEENLTEIVLERWKNIPDPRLREVMGSLIKHLHAFVREIEPTQPEWASAIDFLTRTGKICDEKRQEFILFSDVMGVSMLVDALNHRLPSGATPTTVEGPFHVAEAPPMANGADMATGAPGIPCFVIGKVRDLDGRPVANAILDLWQTDGEGLYEAQRDVTEPWMRGIYRSQQRRILYRAHGRADRLHDPDGWSDRSADETDQHISRCVPPTSTSASNRRDITKLLPICSSAAANTSTPTWSTASRNRWSSIS